MTRRKPVVTAGPVAAPVARTAAQLTVGGFLVEGLDLWFPNATSAEQEMWLALALTFAVSWVQNQIEAWRGRRLIGA